MAKSVVPQQIFVKAMLFRIGSFNYSLETIKPYILFKLI